MLQRYYAVLLMFSLSLAAAAPTAGAQPPSSDRPAAKQTNKARRAKSAAGRLAEEFRHKGLRVGDSLPDITIYDAEGNPFNLRQLKDHYSVIVFGCLT